ncbi:hypothetical protein [Paenarthrobacter ureafaciens]|uniref:hypothetical protein n=2 Tax=Paenarthrobacter ureafaciens TaxID=37931 RepID=UPI002264F947|nr:hypothetical protein [Paenarthrobacter ureafaciens]
MTAAQELLDPIDFVGPSGRLLIDTSVFMDDLPERRGGLKALLQRCGQTIRLNDNPIVIPTDVVAELTKQSRKVDPGRAEAIRRAGVSLGFIGDAAALGLVRTDIGRDSKHYADSVFKAIFTRYANQYDMCLLCNDITPLLHVRLLSHTSSKKLVAGSLTSDGRVRIESDQILYERGVRKLRRKQDEGDAREVAELSPLLADFKGHFGTSELADRRTGSPVLGLPSAESGVSYRAEPFDREPAFKGADSLLEVATIPSVGDKVHFSSPSGSGSVVLDELLGEGGEGAAYAVHGDRVVKIFDRDHVTRHRQAKVERFASRSLYSQGICFPEAVVTNNAGEFVGYMMPRARGNEFRVIMNPRRFLKAFPGWTKADLVDVCISFLEKVSYLHSLNVIVGDINPKNVIVDASKNVWMIDADSWQVDGYPCPVGTPMFTAASALGRPYAESLRTSEEELFAVATMLFMVLITGQFPYARTGSDGDIARLIKDGNFAFQVGERSNRDQPEGNWKYMWSHMPRDLKEMFWNTFHREGQRYTSPPSAEEWLRAFRKYRWWLGSDKNFDPMSNDVYPFRFKAFKPETPILECPQCNRRNALVGEWNEATQDHVVPGMCFDCSQQNRPRCSDCSTPRPAGALKDGRCRDCNRKRDFGTCERCGTETPHRYLVGGRCSQCQLGTCKSCKKSVLKSDLSYGRCTACERRGKELDPLRLCTDCRQSFIDFDHIEWFKGKGLDVAKSHVAIKKQCPPRTTSAQPASSQRYPNVPRAATTTTKQAASKSSARPQPTFWERLTKWWNG